MTNEDAGFGMRLKDFKRDASAKRRKLEKSNKTSQNESVKPTSMDRFGELRKIRRYEEDIRQSIRPTHKVIGNRNIIKPDAVAVDQFTSQLMKWSFKPFDGIKVCDFAIPMPKSVNNMFDESNDKNEAADQLFSPYSNHNDDGDDNLNKEDYPVDPFLRKTFSMLDKSCTIKQEKPLLEKSKNPESNSPTNKQKFKINEPDTSTITHKSVLTNPIEKFGESKTSEDSFSCTAPIPFPPLPNGWSYSICRKSRNGKYYYYFSDANMQPNWEHPHTGKRYYVTNDAQVHESLNGNNKSVDAKCQIKPEEDKSITKTEENKIPSENNAKAILQRMFKNIESKSDVSCVDMPSTTTTTTTTTIHHSNPVNYILPRNSKGALPTSTNKKNKETEKVISRYTALSSLDVIKRS